MSTLARSKQIEGHRLICASQSGGLLDILVIVLIGQSHAELALVQNGVTAIDGAEGVIQLLEKAPYSTRWGKRHKVRTGHIQVAKELPTVLGQPEVPTSVQFEAFD